MTARLTLLIAGALVLASCAGSTSRNPPITIFPDMDYQSRYDPQTDRPFFGDHRASQKPVAGTVARGHLKADEGYFTGVVNNQYIGKNPRVLTAELLQTGRQRFTTYCTPCHDRTGQGRGLVAQRAIWLPTNLHDERVKGFNDGEIFNVMTNGRRTMPSYRFQISEDDRWAIVAYVRALQRSTSATLADVPADRQAEIK